MKKLIIPVLLLGILFSAGVAFAQLPTAIYLRDTTEPATPATGCGVLYITGDTVYFKSDDGTTYDLTTGGGASALNDLTDVTITSPATNELVKYDGSGWVNANANLSELSDTDITSPATGDILYYDGSKWKRLAAGTSGYYLKTNGTTGAPSWASVSGGSKPDFTATFPAGSFYYPTSNPAELDRDTGTNGAIFRQRFDDSTDESVEGSFVVPSDIDTSGTVTFEIIGYAVTATADSVVFVFSESDAGSGSSWDATYNDISSGAKTCNSTQDNLDRFTWTETVANLGWSANELVRFKLTRDADNANDTLVGDYGVIVFRVVIPRS